MLITPSLKGTFTFSGAAVQVAFCLQAGRLVLALKGLPSTGSSRKCVAVNYVSYFNNFSSLTSQLCHSSG